MKNHPLLASPRWRWFADLCEAWPEPADPEAAGDLAAALDAANTRLGTSLPLAVREWYTLLHESVNRCFCQDYFTSPTDLAPHDAGFVFQHEVQGVYLWGVRLEDCHLEDPPVFYQIPGWPEWLPDSPSFTKHIKRSLIHAFTMGGPFYSVAQARDGFADALGGLVPEWDLGDHERPWGVPVRSFANRDFVAEVWGEREVTIAGHTEEALEKLYAQLPPVREFCIERS